MPLYFLYLTLYSTVLLAVGLKSKEISWDHVDYHWHSRGVRLGLEVNVDQFILLGGPISIGVVVPNDLIRSRVSNFCCGVRELYERQPSSARYHTRTRRAIGLPFNLVCSCAIAR